ncbi:MAG: aldo/keto reductase [Candidatus Hydrogenedentes bacterium]|nr:aldo/keto reductase [Candidatus Hydrogenedentota bacterium]
MTDHRDSSSIDRRTFLTGVGAVSAAAFMPRADAKVPENKRISLTGKLPERVLGRTGVTLPILAHGGSALWGSESDYYGVTLESFEDRVKMVRHNYDLGLRYFDTARIYGDSETIMGQALEDVREDVYIASKAMVAEVDKVRESVEKSLAELRTDYVDCMQIHGPIIERAGYDGCMPLYEELAKLREEGMIRFIGMTGHTAFDQMHKMIATKAFDTVLIERGYIKKGYNSRHTLSTTEWRELCIDKAHEVGMGIIAMKVMGAYIFGHNAQNIAPDYDPEKRAKLPAAAIRWALHDDRIHMLNIGVSLPGDVEKNIAILTADTTLTAEDKHLLAEVSAIAYEWPRVKGLREA